MLADLESLEKRVPNLVKKAQQGDKEAKVQASMLGQALELLRDSKPARLAEPKDHEEKARARPGAIADRQARPLRLQCRRGRRRGRQRP
jgi:ribosome-binding ATPase YchF (GTP1/OBG family)